MKRTRCCLTITIVAALLSLSLACRVVAVVPT